MASPLDFMPIKGPKVLAYLSVKSRTLQGLAYLLVRLRDLQGLAYIFVKLRALQDTDAFLIFTLPSQEKHKIFVYFGSCKFIKP